ncbi:FixH family protein [Bacillus sp. 28A-2]|uniref:FixH family protein n=1 Tax=Bacillus sp. 28A-2 TaxID=2772252 RepID=UPI00168D36C6|nr:FixH family protein [Bacillus sp. 28A-2]MBD3860152.1 FixH family protein [Bacillus sp. 28A-2]
MRKMMGIILMLALLSACGNSAANSDKGEVPELLEVKLTGPEQVEKNESVIVKAAVTYGDTPVDDADDVQFEVWKDGNKDNSKMIQPKKENQGVYELHTAFKKDGLYIIQVHVTAKQQHNMPKTKIHVGDVKKERSSTEEKETSHH